MRVISQGKSFDIPYEKTHICLDGENVIGRCDGKEYILGVYSTEEKAVKAMEMCRENYKDCEYNKSALPALSQEIVKLPEELARKFRDGISEKYVFLFPKDEEVKV